MLRVELLVFDRVDLLDMGGPYEVLLTADRISVRDGGPRNFEVVPVSVAAGPVSAYGGLGLTATDRPGEGELDLLVVPGLIDLDSAIGDRSLLDTVARRSARARITASVCTGSLLLAHAGVLADVPATTHHEDLDVLARLIGDELVREARWVDAGDVVTAGGLSNGIAMALHLVDRLVSPDLAIRTARKLAYDWDPTDGLVVARAARSGA